MRIDSRKEGAREKRGGDGEQHEREQNDHRPERFRKLGGSINRVQAAGDAVANGIPPLQSINKV